jgi:hypothetical protein
MLQKREADTALVSSSAECEICRAFERLKHESAARGWIASGAGQVYLGGPFPIERTSNS